MLLAPVECSVAEGEPVSGHEHPDRQLAGAEAVYIPAKQLLQTIGIGS